MMARNYKIVMESFGGTRRLYMEGLTYNEALEICEDNDWVLCADGGYVWDLIIDED